MAHKYYCTNCARELNQDIVLIDMEYALTVSGGETADAEKKDDRQKFQILKFRTTVQEYHDLVAKGTPIDQGYIRIDLSVGELAAFLANERNLKDQKIEALTLEDIDGYLKDRHRKDFGDGDKAAKEALSFANGIGGFNTDAVFGGSTAIGKTEEEAAEEKYIPSEAVQALKNQITSAKNDALNERMLEDDLSLLRKHIGDNGCICMEIKSITKEADDKTKLLVGYEARRGNRHHREEFARCCCYCGTTVFEHAGEAPHQAVAFIGDQGSGKTSTILALTHYAKHAAQSILPEDTIWSRSTSIEGIEYMEPVGVDAVLREDLGWYAIGVAPEKTEAQKREDAYSSTFWIVNKWGKKFILTLIDLPGELCKPDGTIDSTRIKDEFPVAMASDSFIMCFDTQEAKGSKAADIILMTRSWADKFQRLRREYKMDAEKREPGDTSPELGEKCVAPMMVVFTKCDELEGKKAEGTVVKERTLEPDRVKEIYSLKGERDYIDLNPVYKRVGNDIKTYEDLENAYVARLRTSPYGFSAPKKSVYLASVEAQKNSTADPKPRLANENENGTIRYPRPVHVAELMRWLLTVTGCIPTPAVYIPDPNEPERRRRLENVFVRGAQYRVWKPQGRSKDERIDAAMCRAYLFENYSGMDREIIESWDTPIPVPIPVPIPKNLVEKVLEFLRGR